MRSSFRRWGVVCAAVAFAWSVHAAPPRWTRVEGPSFTILCEGSPKVALSWAAEFEQFRRGVTAVLGIGEAALPPVTVVMFANDKRLRPYKPRENGKPADVAGFFVRGTFLNAIGLSAPAIGASRDVVYHEAVHWITESHGMELPAWFSEGIAEVYSTFEPLDTGFQVGHAIPGHVALVRRGKLTPTQRLTGTLRQNIVYSERDRTSRFYAESWLLCHYLMFGKGNDGARRVREFFWRVRKGEIFDSAFSETFGRDFTSLDEQLRAYLRGGSYLITTYKVSRSDAMADLRVGQAEPAEVELALAELLIGTDQHEAARRPLQRVMMLAPENPRGWELLGAVAAAEHQDSEACDHFEQAITLGSQNPEVHLTAGLLITKNLGMGAMHGAFGAQQAENAAKHFLAALARRPQWMPALEGLAMVAGMIELPTPEQRQTLEEGLRLASDNDVLMVGLAALKLRVNRGERASGMATLRALAVRESPALDARLAAYVPGLIAVGEWIDLQARLETALSARRYEEVLSLIEIGLARKDQDPASRRELLRMQAVARGAHAIEQALELFRSGKADEGKVRLRAIIEAGKPADLVAEARRILRAVEDNQAGTR